MQEMDFGEMTVSSLLSLIELESFITEDLQLPHTPDLRQCSFGSSRNGTTGDTLAHRREDSSSRDLKTKIDGDSNNVEESGGREKDAADKRVGENKGKFTATIDNVPTCSNFYKEIASLLSVLLAPESTLAHGQDAVSLHKEHFEGGFLSDHESEVGSGEEDRVTSAIHISLGRWVDYLEVHCISSSYNDLLQVNFTAKCFLERVEFYFLSFVDIQMKSARLCKDFRLDFKQGVSFPPIATLQFDSSINRQAEHLQPDIQCFLKLKPSSDTTNTKNELHGVQEWLIDALQYFENQKVTVFYEPFRMLRHTAKKLVKLLEMFLRDYVDQLLERSFAIKNVIKYEQLASSVIVESPSWFSG